MKTLRTVAMTSAVATAVATTMVATGFLSGCSEAADAATGIYSPGTDKTHAADDKALRALVDRTVAAAGKLDAETYAKYYGPKWVSALPGHKIEVTTGPLKMKFPDGYKIKMITTNTGFSDAGDLGWAVGTYEQTAPDKAGKLEDTTGQWMSVFKKQPDGSWGAVFDTYNVDPR